MLKEKQTSLSMSIFLKASHSPIFVMQNGDNGVLSPVENEKRTIEKRYTFIF